MPENPGLRQLIRMVLRREELCPNGPRDCIDALSVQCRDCQCKYQPADIRMPDGCPRCGARRYLRLACAQCPDENLDQLIRESGYSGLLQHVFDFAQFLAKGGTVTLDDIDMEQWAALRILWAEQDKYSLDRTNRMEQDRGHKIQHRYQTRPV